LKIPASIFATFSAAALTATGALAAKNPASPPPPAPQPVKIALPEWLYPIDPASIHPPPTPPKLDDKELLTIPDSTEKFTAARIGDRYEPPDWFPAEHGPMPDIVAKGRKPAVTGCAYCHTPTGQGRPENSALAGLTENYIREQLKDFRSGARKPSGPEAFKPDSAMTRLAATLTDAEIDEAAKYFAAQKLARRVWIIESLRIPRAEPNHWVYEEVPGTEDLNDRLLEVAPDIERHERRDPRMQYNAYVPPGSIGRGKRLVSTGDGKTTACATCHGVTLKGLNDVPPIAGRSPTTLLRQLLAFKTGGRVNENAKLMAPVVEKLEVNDMVDIVAYLGTLYPTN
jgi:cytochrome c553